MPSPTMIDMMSRVSMAEKKPKHWVPKAKFHPGGQKGKLHRELGIAEDRPIPPARLAQAAHSKNPEVKRDAIRARTMKKWHHGKSKMYERSRAKMERG
jgi:hypothetical protein